MKTFLRSRCGLLLLLLGATFSVGAVVPGDIIYVADVNNGAIRQFDAMGQGSAFGTVGFVNPVGLAVDATGNLFVANRSGGVTGTIDRFTPGGTRSQFSADMSFPAKLAFGPDGLLYAGMVGNNTIRRFNAAGQGSTFASAGLNGPIPLAFDSHGNLYVGNTGNGTIVKFNSAGQSQFFANPGQYPYGLAFDAADNLFVANFGANAIQKINPAGTITTFAGLGDGINAPVDLVFDGAGNLFVLNLGSNTILKFDPAGNGSLFAHTGMDHPESLAIYIVPEPTCGILLLLTGVLLLKRRS